MSRSFGSNDLVQLPRLDLGGAQALGTAVVAAARGIKKLPEPVEESLGEVEAGLKVINDLAAGRLAPSGDPLRAIAADRVVDGCWSGIYDWLTGWSKMPDLPEAGLALELRSRLFPDGLKFIQLGHNQEWAESDSRLRVIHKDHLDLQFEQLGGAKVLGRLRQAHEAYGKVLGITAAPAPAPDSGPGATEALQTFGEALRSYVVQATAMVRKSHPASAEISARLLAPIMEWQSAASRPSAPAPVPPPVPPAA